MRKLIVIVLFFNPFYLFSQEMTPASVDKKTYQYYAKGEWKELIKIGEKAQKDSIKFYYLNVRMGVAYFYTKSYLNAQKQFKIAQKIYAYNPVVNELLFWTDYNLGNNYQADLDLNYLTNSVKERIHKKPMIEKNMLYTEAGVKLYDDNSQNGTYLNTTLSLQPIKRVNWSNSYTKLEQLRPWGDYAQEQFYSALSYQINPKYTIAASYHTIWNTTNFTETNTETTYPYQFEESDDFGTYDVKANDSVISYSTTALTQRANLITLSLAANFNRLVVAPQFTYFDETINSTTAYLDTTNSSYDYYSQIDSSLLTSFYKDNDTSYSASSSTKSAQYQPALFLGYTPNIFNDRIFIGVNLLAAKTSTNTSFLIMPSLSLRIRDNLYINASYFQKKNYFLSQNDGAIFYNSNDEINKFSATINYSFLAHFGLYLTYQNEQIIDAVDQTNYKLNSILFGLKLKL